MREIGRSPQSRKLASTRRLGALGLMLVAGIWAAAGSCSQSDTVVLVNVVSTEPLAGIQRLHVTLVIAGKSRMLDIPPSPAEIVLPTSFTVQMASSLSGRLDITVEAWDADKATLATGVKSILSLKTGAQNDVVVDLTGGGGGPDGQGGAGGQPNPGAGGDGSPAGGQTGMGGGAPGMGGVAGGGGRAGGTGGAAGANGGGGGVAGRGGSSGGAGGRGGVSGVGGRGGTSSGGGGGATSSGGAGGGGTTSSGGAGGSDTGGVGGTDMGGAGGSDTGGAAGSDMGGAAGSS
jgi:hypothetical protein